ncbi:putative MATE family efflux protein [Bacilli bacterium PM5-3]|nr:putative MATE family efflux protein [Bacilli bacterium PM5-3]MDH6604000.1 putative MATE family efflux protein [Bacilli bacterium PM5-9]
MSNKEIMGTAKISSLLLKFSLPATVGMLINAFYNIVDRIFIGNSSDLGADGLAGITITFPVVMIIMAVALMCGVGGSTLFSINLGERNYDKVKKIVGNSFSLALITALFCSIVIYLFMDTILIQFGASEIILPYAKDYLSIILLGAVFQGINMTGNNLIRADGSPKIAMLSILIGAGINIILDPIFIFNFRWGMFGAALATIIGQFASTIWVIYYFTKGKANYKLKLKNMVLEKALAIKIMVTGIPSFFIQVSGSILNVVLNTTLLKYGGDVAISAMGIVNSVQTLLLMPIIGINQGALPIIGFNYGANNLDRIKETIKIASLMATGIAVICFILTRVFSKEIIMIFNQDKELVEIGSNMLIYWFMCLPVVGFGMVGSNYFQAIGKVIPAIFLSLSRQLIILVPLILFLSSLYGLNGLVLAAPIADVVSTILVAILLTISLRNLSKKAILNE